MTPITREDLEMAAKAAGNPQGSGITFHGADVFWRPHEDDGDCARMCAAVGIDRTWTRYSACASMAAESSSLAKPVYSMFMDHANDKCAAERYASVKLAAAVGRAM